jgi:hypothetical protein
MSNAISAHGFTIELNDVGIPELRDITPPALNRESIEKTTRDQDDEDFWLDIRRYGELSFDMNFVLAEPTHAALLDAFTEGTSDDYRLTFPDGAVWRFDGLVIGFRVVAAVDDKLWATVTVRPAQRVNVANVDFLLQENGDALLQENDGRILL